ncbi:MAG: hypothetical protein GXP45_07430 [bacterium]|nr:hypothetical protein [bacterium]
MSGFFANPGKIYNINNYRGTGNYDDNYTTGDIDSGNNSSGDFSTGILPCPISNPPLQISEIFP